MAGDDAPPTLLRNASKLMGKRELVLVAAFLVMGIVVYQVTAPPPPPGSEGVSIGGIVQKLKREVQGSRETATATSAQSKPVEASVKLVRLNIPRNNALIITGSDRSDVAVEMQVTARGFNQAEAKAAADAAKVSIEAAGDALAITTVWPMRQNNQSGFISEGTITVSLPRRLQLRLEPHSGRLTISDVAGVEVLGQRGETRISKIAGHVALNHTGGRLEIESIPSLKLTARNSNASVRGIAGTVSMETIGAELQMEDIAGPLEIEARNTELVFDAAKLLEPPFRYNGTGGVLRLSNLRTESRLDGRNVEIEVTVAAAAPITIYSTGEDIRVTAPPGGYALDAVATEGDITSEDSSITATPGDSPDARVTANIRGGGPPLTLRATRARIDIRKSAGK
jgi:hypothetical protein